MSCTNMMELKSTCICLILFLVVYEAAGLTDTACYGSQSCDFYYLQCAEGEIISLNDLYVGRKNESVCQSNILHCDNSETCCSSSSADDIEKFNIQNTFITYTNCSGRRACTHQSPWQLMTSITQTSTYVHLDYDCQNRTENVNFCGSLDSIDKKAGRNVEVFFDGSTESFDPEKASKECECSITHTLPFPQQVLIELKDFRLFSYLKTGENWDCSSVKYSSPGYVAVCGNGSSDPLVNIQTNFKYDFQYSFTLSSSFSSVINLKNIHLNGRQDSPASIWIALQGLSGDIEVACREVIPANFTSTTTTKSTTTTTTTTTTTPKPTTTTTTTPKPTTTTTTTQKPTTTTTTTTPKPTTTPTTTTTTPTTITTTTTPTPTTTTTTPTPTTTTTTPKPTTTTTTTTTKPTTTTTTTTTKPTTTTTTTTTPKPTTTTTTTTTQKPTTTTTTTTTPKPTTTTTTTTTPKPTTTTTTTTPKPTTTTTTTTPKPTTTTTTTTTPKPTTTTTTTPKPTTKPTTTTSTKSTTTTTTPKPTTTTTTTPKPTTTTTTTTTQRPTTPITTPRPTTTRPTTTSTRSPGAPTVERRRGDGIDDDKQEAQVMMAIFIPVAVFVVCLTCFFLWVFFRSSGKKVKFVKQGESHGYPIYNKMRNVNIVYSDTLEHSVNEVDPNSPVVLGINNYPVYSAPEGAGAFINSGYHIPNVNDSPLGGDRFHL